MSDADCVQLTRDDAGRTFLVHVGDAVCIDLPETPTTGYRWRVTEIDKSVVELDHDRFELTSSQPGAGGVRHLRFLALHPGETAIVLHRRRSWNSDPQSEYSFQITAHVSGG